MTKYVDHDERQKEIMKKTLRLIGERGYHDVTYQQIADVCGLSRTTLYKYFEDKREIFDCAILQLVENLGVTFTDLINANPDLDTCGQIRLICRQVVDTMYLNPPLLQAIVEYLIGLRRRGEPVRRRIRRHTIAIHRTLVHLIREGVAKGELRPCDCSLVAESFYALLEAVTLRIALMEGSDQEDFMKMFDLAISGLRKQEDAT